MPRKKRKVSPAAAVEREETVKAAVKAGQSIRQTAKQFGIAYSTPHDNCSGEL